MRVIRFSKSTAEEGSEDQKKKIMRDALFANEIMRPSIGFEYVGHVSAVKLPADQVEELNKLLLNNNLRPSKCEHSLIINTL